MEERETALRRAALSYEDAEVVIEVVRELELAGATTFAGAHVLSSPSNAYIPAKPASAGRGRCDHSQRAGERKSKRARKGRAPVRVSSSHTLWDLKLRVLEVLEVHPKNAVVHAWRGNHWLALTPDTATLAGLPHVEFLVLWGDQLPATV